MSILIKVKGKKKKKKEEKEEKKPEICLILMVQSFVSYQTKQ